MLIFFILKSIEIFIVFLLDINSWLLINKWGNIIFLFNDYKIGIKGN